MIWLVVAYLVGIVSGIGAVFGAGWFAFHNEKAMTRITHSVMQTVMKRTR